MDLSLHIETRRRAAPALIGQDLDLLVEAARGETGGPLWSENPRDPYSTHDAQAKLYDWGPSATLQVSCGVVEDGRTLGALGFMRDGMRSAELTYRVRP